MLFNSISFAIFLPVVLILYWSLSNKNIRFQNTLLLVSSYFFYACWDYRFLFLLIFSTVLDYLTGLKINSEVSNSKNKKIWFYSSIFINLGFLCIFKYYNFFVDSFSDALSLLGIKVSFNILQFVLPVGISFYTFHGLSYVIDIYKGKIEPEKNFVDYSLFVSFFPLLVAGPIERASHLLPQIKRKRVFNYSKSVDGLKQILWGLFKKIVIADNCARFANIIFNDFDLYPGSTLLLGAIFFTFQIYCDFSGYSDIALGVARLFGFELLRNFAFPYFSRNIAEFWRRWHISLSTWFRDYLYIPLGGSKGGVFFKIRNTFIIFLVSGFWHGANWTFIFWGALNALYFLPSLLFNNNRNYLDTVSKDRFFPTIKEFFQIIITFCFTVFAWIFFRSLSLHNAFLYISKIFSASLFSNPYFPGIGLTIPTIVFTLLLIFVEWIGRESQYGIQSFLLLSPRAVRWTFYCLIIASILAYNGGDQQFIYFQF